METHFCKDCKHCLLAEDTKESRCLVTPKESTFFVDGKRLGGPEQYHHCTEVRTKQHCSQFDPIIPR